MEKHHNAGAIIWNADKQEVLLVPRENHSKLRNNGDTPKFFLPKVKLFNSANAPQELKRDLNETLSIALRFRKILPDTWSKLVFATTDEDTSLLTIFYIYDVVDFNKQRLKEWFRLDALLAELASRSEDQRLKLLDEEDSAALELFAHLV